MAMKENSTIPKSKLELHYKMQFNFTPRTALFLFCWGVLLLFRLYSQYILSPAKRAQMNRERWFFVYLFYYTANQTVSPEILWPFNKDIIWINIEKMFPKAIKQKKKRKEKKDIKKPGKLLKMKSSHSSSSSSSSSCCAAHKYCASHSFDKQDLTFPSGIIIPQASYKQNGWMNTLTS